MGGLDGNGHSVRIHRLEGLKPTRSTVPGHLGLLRRTEDRTDTRLYRTCVDT